MRPSHRSVVLLLAVGMFLTVSRSAHAYIDAGSGSYLLQIVFAALFGAAFAVKTSFANFKATFLNWMSQRKRTANHEGA